jgi:two-component system, OmpR family, sensor histidine kinase MtrB
VVSINRVQSRSAQQQAVHWDNLANTTGIAGSALLIVLLVMALAWLTTQVITPIVRLRNTMDRFALGDFHARAPESGPAELRAMAAQFNGMAAALAQQRQAQMSYLAGAAHDMRSPLTALKASVALTRMQSALPSEEQIRRAFTLVERQIGALEHMVSDLLDTARIEAGKFELHLSDCDLRELTRDAVELFQSGSPHHRLHLSEPERPVVVRSDPTRLQQILHNLVGNAIKYSPSGGDVHVEVTVSGDAAQLAVTDQGIGVAPEELPHIFEPFRRATSGKMQGAGLGLFIVRQIAEAHGGSIDVVSRPGEGSRFTVELPLTGPEGSTPPALGSAVAPLAARTTRQH